MVRNRLAVAAVLLLAVWCSTGAAFYQGTDVITLDEASFNSRIRKGGVWMVEVRLRSSRSPPGGGHLSICLQLGDDEQQGAAVPAPPQ